MKNMIAILNPKAGKGTGRSVAQKFISLLESHANVQIIETKSPGHAIQIASEQYNQGVREFICMGGDGTLYETINGLFQQGGQGSKLAVVPVGTGNSFLKDFNSKIPEIAQKIIQNQTRACDVIQTQHAQGTLHWINIFSFGFTADVAATRNQKFPNAGTIGYTLSVLLELHRLTSFPVSMKLDGKALDTDAIFISINNTRYTGGNMMMAPGAIPDDGFLEVIEVRRMSRFQLIKAFPKIFQGTHVFLPQIKTYRAKHIDFSFDQSLDIMIDGELKKIQPISMKVLPKAIQIYA